MIDNKKYIVVLVDGMADEPIAELNNLTPVMAANTPVIDKICSLSVTGQANTIPEGFHPGSEIANMNILGYHPKDFFQGRGVIEAASLGIKTEPNDLVLRCNLVSIENEILVNHSAGHITTDEATQIIDFLNFNLGSERIKFYTGKSYRHILVIKGGSSSLVCTPPHDHPGKIARNLLPVSSNPKGNATAELLNELIEKSIELLKNHPVNIERKNKGKSKADSIWPWSPGYYMQYPTFWERWGIKSGGVISAVDLIHGLGKMAGLESVFVEGATGLWNTNYEGKAIAALETLKKHPFVFIHIEAMDEAGHDGDFMLKKRVIEDIDQRLLKLLWDGLNSAGYNFSLMLLPDHPTPCKLRTHTSDPVPVLLYNKKIIPDTVNEFNEISVKNGSLGTINGPDLLSLLFKE